MGKSFLRAREFIERRRRALIVAWLFGCVGIVIGSLMPTLAPPDMSIAVLPLDKLIHFGAYGLTAFLPQVAISRLAPATLAALSMAVLGGTVEIAQSFVPGREGSLGDALINTLGVLGGVALGLSIRLRLR